MQSTPCDSLLSGEQLISFGLWRDLIHEKYGIVLKDKDLCLVSRLTKCSIMELLLWKRPTARF